MPKKEKHWGTVIDNQDPMKRGRLIVECPTITEGDVLEWIAPSFHFTDSGGQAGSVWIPGNNSEIEIEIEAEDDSEVTDLEPKWVCCVYPEGTFPPVFQTNYPERRGWVTRAGHILYFDDTDGELEFKYIHPSGTELVVNNSGEMQLTPAAGQSVLIGDSADQKLVRGNNLFGYMTNILKTWANAHTHPVTGAVAGPTTVLLTDPSTDILSDDHKVK